MMRRLVPVLLVLVLLAPAAGCSDGSTTSGRRIEGSGNVVSLSREVAGFDRIVLSGAGTVLVSQEGSESLVIETDDNLIDYLTSEVKGSTLEISVTDEARNATLDPTRGITYRVGVDDLHGLVLAGAGQFRADRLESDRIEIEVAGAGDVRVTDLTASEASIIISGSGGVHLAGVATSQEVTLGGAGNYDGADLESEQAGVTLSGTGDVVVWVTGTLTAALSGTGSISYYGDPTVSQNVTGTGAITGRGAR